MDINTLIEQLATARAQEELYREERRCMEQALKENPAYQFAKKMETECLVLEDEIRSLIIKAAETQDHPAVAWKTFKYVDYDQDDVTDWARENLQIVLVLDTAVFEDIAKKLNAVPGVFSHAQEKRLTIAQDLTRYIL